MYKRITALLILSVLIAGQSFAHSGKPKYHVIIDTDGALDDMRAISMFLSGNDIRVLAVTCSQGTLLPETVYEKVKSLLSAFHHEGIQVGIGENTGRELPDRSSFDRGITWGTRGENDLFGDREDAGIILERATENYPDKITLVALGSLKTYADWLQSDPSVIDKINGILWLNGRDIENGFNYKASPESYEYIRESGIDLVIVGNSAGNVTIDDAYLNVLKNTDSPYARQTEYVHKQFDSGEVRLQDHFQFRDDMVPLYLVAPLLFDSEKEDNVRIVRLNQSIPGSFIHETVARLLESATITNNRVFNAFPVEASLYKPEYAELLHSTIEKFGVIEWKAISLTNEIHGHTGIYSIIGAKMGIRAMEFFNVGINNLTVTSFAGDKPPLSCLNDGIQISTGATIGQGLITVSDSISIIPAAYFAFNNQVVEISLKPGIAEQMQEDIRYGVQTYGALTDQYWLYIEALALKYWSEFSRFEIFDLTLRD